MAHERSFPCDAYSACYFLAAVVHILQRGCYNGHVVVGIYAARYGEAQQVKPGKAVLACNGVAVGQQVSYLASAYSGLEVQLYRKRLGGEFLFGNACEHLRGVNEYGVAAGRTLVGNAVPVEQAGKILYLVDARLEVVELRILVQSDGKRVHVAAVHASVSKVTFKLYAKTLCAFVPLFLVGGDETTHIHDAVLLGAHRHSVGQGEHLACNLLYCFVGVACLACLDEVRVFGEACRVEDYGLAILVGNGAHLAQVFH